MGPSWGARDQVLGLDFQSSIWMDTCLISDPLVPVLMTDRPQARPQLGVQPTALLSTDDPAGRHVGSLAGSPALFRAVGASRGPWCPPPPPRPDIARQPPELLPAGQECQPWPDSPPRTQGHCGCAHGFRFGGMGGGQVCRHQCWHLDRVRFPHGLGCLRGRPSTCAL